MTPDLFIDDVATDACYWTDTKVKEATLKADKKLEAHIRAVARDEKRKANKERQRRENMALKAQLAERRAKLLADKAKEAETKELVHKSETAGYTVMPGDMTTFTVFVGGWRRLTRLVTFDGEDAAKAFAEANSPARVLVTVWSADNKYKHSRFIDNPL